MEETGRMGHHLFAEGEQAQFLYILFNGTIEYFKLIQGIPVALSQVTHFSIIGMNVDESDNYWMAAKIVSAFASLYKISKSTLLNQLKRWGYPTLEPPIRKEWIKEQYVK